MSSTQHVRIFNVKEGVIAKNGDEMTHYGASSSPVKGEKTEDGKNLYKENGDCSIVVYKTSEKAGYVVIRTNFDPEKQGAEQGGEVTIVGVRIKPNPQPNKNGNTQLIFGGHYESTRTRTGTEKDPLYKETGKAKINIYANEAGAIHAVIEMDYNPSLKAGDNEEDNEEDSEDSAPKLSEPSM